MPERGIITSAYDAIEVGPDHDPRFWAYTLLALDLAKYYYSLGGGVRQSINFSDFPNDWIGTPSRDNQQQIANVLDHETNRIDRLIEKKQRMVELFEYRLSALIANAVTRGLKGVRPIEDSDKPLNADIPTNWEWVALGRKIRLQRGVDITKDQQEEGPYPVISSGGVASYHSKYICRGPGVLIGRKGSAGKLHFEERNYWPHDTTLYVKSFINSDPRFVFYKLMSLDIGSYDRSSANPTINRNVLHPIKVAWPSMDEQKAIAAALDLESNKSAILQSKVKTSVDTLREFRAALITAAVTGQIDIAEWQRRGSSARLLDEETRSLPHDS